jgi:hypothetical protein
MSRQGDICEPTRRYAVRLVITEDGVPRNYWYEFGRYDLECEAESRVRGVAEAVVKADLARKGVSA